MSSMDCSKSRAMAKASGRLGSYFSVSIAFTVWRDTLSRPAKSAWDHSRSARKTRSRFFIAHQLADYPSSCHHCRSAGSSVPPGGKPVGESPQQQHEASYLFPRRTAEPSLLHAAEKGSDDESQQERDGRRLQADPLLHLVHLQEGAHHRREEHHVGQNRQNPHPPRTLPVSHEPCHQEFCQRRGNRPQKDWAGEAGRECSTVRHETFHLPNKSKVGFTI